MKIVTKLILSFLALIIMYSVITWGIINESSQRIYMMLEKNKQAVDGVNHTRSAWDEFRNALDYANEVLAMTDVVDGNSARKEFEKHYLKFTTELDKAKQGFGNDSSLEIQIVEAKVQGEKWKNATLDKLSISNVEYLPSEIELDRQSESLEHSINLLVESVVKNAESFAIDMGKAVEEEHQREFRIFVILAIVSFALSIVIALTISRPITHLRKSMIALADNNYTDNIPYINLTNEIGAMAKALTVFKENGLAKQKVETKMHRVIDELASSAEALLSFSEQTYNSLKSQQNTVENVSLHVEETSYELSLIGDETKEMLSLSHQAQLDTGEISSEVDASSKAVEESVDQMQNVVNEIEKLKQESSNIGEVLQVITGISEQTNLLALNAAIEAARAGEHGRGFSVVADEVRNLSNMTRDSTNKIQKMIDSMQSGTENVVNVIEQSRKLTNRNHEAMVGVTNSLIRIRESVQAVGEKNTITNERTNLQLQKMNVLTTSILNVDELGKRTLEQSNNLTHISNKLNGLSSDLSNLFKS